MSNISKYWHSCRWFPSQSSTTLNSILIIWTGNWLVIPWFVLLNGLIRQFPAGLHFSCPTGKLLLSGMGKRVRVAAVLTQCPGCFYSRFAAVWSLTHFTSNLPLDNIIFPDRFAFLPATPAKLFSCKGHRITLNLLL